jgi:hypothetical protein
MIRITAAICVALAADWPARPVRLMLGFAAGGPTDIRPELPSRHLAGPQSFHQTLTVRIIRIALQPNFRHVQSTVIVAGMKVEPRESR